MFNGILDAAFLQAACAHATPEPPTPVEPDGIVFQTTEAMSVYFELTGTGEVNVKYTHNGEVQTLTYNNPNEEDVDIETDANTDIIITGNVPNLALSPSSVNKIKEVRALNSVITSITIGNQNNLKTLCLPTTITSASISNCTGVTTIKYPANNSGIATKIADIITNATAADGVVYTDSEGAYYSTIADAATAKGWTVEQIPT